MLVRIRQYRTLSIGIAAMLLLSVAGLHLNVHYCQGILAGVSLVSAESCDMGQMKDGDGCCSQSEQDSDCCEDVESFSVLEYDGLSYSGPQLDSESNVSHVFSTIPTTIEEIEREAEVYLKIKPPEAITPSGLKRRILIQSLLC